MFKIVHPDISQIPKITEVARQSFIQSHSHSAPAKDFENYIHKNFTIEVFEQEILNETFDYRLMIDNERIVGYSKIVANMPIAAVKEANITKLERIYLLEEFYGNGMAKALLEYNIELAKSNNQYGMWLYVWIENHRAIKFYQKMGFEIVGKYDFQISQNHSNPNHQLFLKF